MAALFPIMLEVEESRVGAVLRLLTGYPGVAKLHLDLDGIGKKPGRRIGEKRTNGNGAGPHPRDHDIPTAKTVVLGHLMSGAKNLDFLKEKLSEIGHRSAGIASTTLHDLQKKGVTHKIGKGLHDLTPEAREKMQAHPIQETEAAPEIPQLAAPTNKPDRSFTRPWVFAQVSEGLSRTEMRTKGAPLGINERMIDGALTRLKAEKIILAGTEPGRFKVAPGKKPGAKP